MGKYLDKIRQHERTQPEEASTQQKALAVHPGDRITWHRADGAVQHGVVDYIHTDADGGSWGFVTLGGTWAAVNLRFATVRSDADTRYPPMSPDLVA